MALATYTIPLKSVPETFIVSLAGTEYALTLRWYDVDQGGWVLDIDLPEKAGHVVCGIPLVTGVDLLAPYAYLGIGGALVVWAGDNDDAPTRDNLGDGVDLLFVVEESDG